MLQSLFSLLAAGAMLILPAQAREVQDALGRKVQAPDAPRRILALSEPDLDALLALGAPPLAASRGRGQNGFPAYLQQAPGIKQVAQLGNFMQTGSEAIMQYKPDLILAGSHNDPAQLAQWSKIAPVIVSFTPGETWESGFLRIAAALDKSEQAQQLLHAQQQEIARLKQQLKPASISIVRWNISGPAFMQRDAFASRLIHSLGWRRPPAQALPGSAHSAPLSQEAFAVLDADWIAIGGLGPQAQQDLHSARKHPAMAQLHAVRQGRMRVVDGAVWTGPGGYLAAQALLRDIAQWQ
ncbi:ABC transporter substrate-binding protein [Massilia sp. W12]|uniref:ABC transporter substrate-binding protein n=1 Tax=Massilia sp. W12 TaxID=3126507 RepID=UPI0030D09BCE